MPQLVGQLRVTRVRDADAADAHSIAAIGRVAVPRTYEDLIQDPEVVRSIVAQSYAPAALRESIERCRRADDAHFLVAERDGETVGFLDYDRAGPEPELHRIYVDPAAKRQGIGSVLLRALHDRLPDEATYVLMVIAANEGAVRFYECHGLVVAEKLNGVEYMHERMGVQFPPGTAHVPALIMRYRKRRGDA